MSKYVLTRSLLGKDQKHYKVGGDFPDGFDKDETADFLARGLIKEKSDKKAAKPGKNKQAKPGKNK